MGRKYVDCRDTPSVSGCTVAIAADSEDELVEAAIQHMIVVHEHDDSAELRHAVRQGMKDLDGAVV
jgi:predicted small metal-binding protein